MSLESLHFIIQNLNSPPFNCNTSLIAFDLWSSTNLLQQLSDVISWITQTKKVDVMRETAEETALRLLHKLKILKFEAPTDIGDLEEWRCGLVEGTKRSIYPILSYLFTNIDTLKQRAYLAKYLVKCNVCLHTTPALFVEVPSDVHDIDTSQMQNDVAVLMERFKATHTRVLDVQQYSMFIEDIRSDLKSMVVEKDVLSKKIEKALKEMGYLSTLERQMTAVNELRLQKSRLSALDIQRFEQREAVIRAETKIHRLKDYLMELHVSSENLDPSNLIIPLEGEITTNTYLVDVKLALQLQQKRNVVGELSKVSAGSNEILQAEQEKDKCEERNDENSSIFRQQASSVERRKDATAQKMQEASDRKESPDSGGKPGTVAPGGTGLQESCRLPKRKRTRMAICTYNARTLVSEVAIEDLMMQAKKIKYDVIGLTETRRRHPLNAVYETGEELFLGTCDSRVVGGVDVLVNTRTAKNIDSFEQLTTRIGRLRMRRCGPTPALTIFVAYAPTSSYEEEVEAFYMDLEKFYREDHAFYKVIIGYFNAKVGARRTPEELHIGTHGLQWNDQGERLSEFIMTTKPIHGNSQFQKPSSLRWTWESPGGGCGNEIDHIVVNKRFSLTDVAVVPKFYTGSDHRLLRGKFSFTRRAEKAAKFRERNPRTAINWDLFATLAGFWEDSAMDNIDEEYDRLVEHLHDCAKKAESFKTTKRRLSLETLELIRQQRRGEVLAEAAEAGKASAMPVEFAVADEDDCSPEPKGTPLLEKGGGKSLAFLFSTACLASSSEGRWTLGSPSKYDMLSVDPHDIGNYRPICLLSVIYKLFTRVILNRIEKVLDEGQPCEQAGFRKGFSTIDHIHTVSKLIELSREYKIPLCLTFIDLKKDFDSVETEAVVEALDNQGVPTQYIKVLRELYSSFTTRTSPFYKNIIIDVKRGSDRMTQFHPKYSQLPSRTQCESWNGTTWE
ncbi:hypothetical protein RB195_023046 [Necator americanus]|uniref:Reverse transcriptase domain-containing protein n=1 Tax=Necator americanus TaxID=51031 RepID=A0ABR1EHV1_NECAM